MLYPPLGLIDDLAEQLWDECRLKEVRGRRGAATLAAAALGRC
jgi:hypothetical protein